MRIETVQQYNQRQRVEYDVVVRNWSPGYLFISQRTGEDYKYGYVASNHNSAFYARTKKEAIAKFEAYNKR
jgi:hypothetical protein